MAARLQALEVQHSLLLQVKIDPDISEVRNEKECFSKEPSLGTATSSTTDQICMTPTSSVGCPGDTARNLGNGQPIE